MRKGIYLTVSIATIAIILSLTFGSQPVRAAGTGPTVYVDTTLYRTTLLTTPVIVTAATSVGSAKTIYVKLARAPQENHEPELPTDKTFAWGFTLTYDTTMFRIASIATDITEEPLTVTTVAQFLKRRMYAYNPDPLVWELSGIYSTSFAKGEGTPGVLTLGDTLVAPSPTTVPLPPEYFDGTIGPTAPDVGRHLGTSYDLPSTLNSTQAVLQLDGSTTVTDPSYCLLAIIKLTATAVPPGGYAGSAFHLSDIILIDADTQTSYFASSGGSTMDGYYVKTPVVPEFPLGLAPTMALAAAIPIVYLWRRRKVIKQ